MLIMATHDNAKAPLLGGSVNDAVIKCKENTNNNAITRRKYGRTKSAPSTQYFPSKFNHCNPPPPLHNPCNKPILLHVLLALALYLGVGTICFVLIRGQLDGKKTIQVVDALYFCIVTMTTVGYGDLVPATSLAKLLSCLFVFSGMAIVAIILSKAADYFVEKNEALVARAFHLRDKNITTADILKEVETNKTEYKFMIAFILLVLLMTLGTSVLTFHEKLSLIDALYCVCATITTLGYGDESFGTAKGRMFAVFWILSSTVCLAQFFFYLTELYTERRRRTLLKWVLDRKLTFADIEAADNDRMTLR